MALIRLSSVGLTSEQCSMRWRRSGCGHRLSARYRKLVARDKLPAVAVTAIARESLGFIWAIARAAAPRR